MQKYRLALVQGTYITVVRLVSKPLEEQCCSTRVVQFNATHIYTEGAHNPGPTWPPAQLPSATGVFP